MAMAMAVHYCGPQCVLLVASMWHGTEEAGCLLKWYFFNLCVVGVVFINLGVVGVLLFNDGEFSCQPARTGVLATALRRFIPEREWGTHRDCSGFLQYLVKQGSLDNVHS